MNILHEPKLARNSSIRNKTSDRVKPNVGAAADPGIHAWVTIELCPGEGYEGISLKGLYPSKLYLITSG